MKAVRQSLVKVFFIATLKPSGVFAQYNQHYSTAKNEFDFIGPAVQMANWIIAVFVLYLILMSLNACVIFFTSGGDENRMDQSITWWKYSFAGLFLAVVVYVSVNMVGGE